MISRLASPSVCVIDDEAQDYGPILDALLRLGLGCVHIRGDNIAVLPPQPFNGLRIVFTDLHLSGLTGKGAAAHTAKVFTKVVSPETAPVVVVIWSKYANDIVADPNLPPDDQPTEADLFKQAVLTAEPKYKERLVFVQMTKPKPVHRPKSEKWVNQLQRSIQKELQNLEAFDVLWAWESIVRDAGIAVTQELTTLALLPEPNGPPEKTLLLPEKLKLALRLLVREQGGPGCSALTAPRHLASALAQSLVDHLEHSNSLGELAKHGKWLSNQTGTPKTSPIAPGINGLFLTAASSKRSAPFVPGNIYRLAELKKFEKTFGVPANDLVEFCYNGAPAQLNAWKAMHTPQPIVIELSPVCDVQHETRCNALLIGGLIFPAAAFKSVKRADAIEKLPVFSLRWPAENFAEQDAFLVFCSRYKATMNPKKEPTWLIPWFRLRELPTAALRNWHATHASRVGYVSL
jgi:hypothetical protein